MNLSNNKKFNAGEDGKNDLYDLTHTDEHRGKYGENPHQSTAPKDHLYNSRNLFDDLNSKDREWAKLAKVHLREAGSFRLQE